MAKNTMNFTDEQKEIIKQMMDEQAKAIAAHFQTNQPETKAEVKSKRDIDIMSIGERLLDKATSKTEKVIYNLLENEDSLKHSKKALKNVGMAIAANIVQSHVDLGDFATNIIDAFEGVQTASAIYNGYKAVTKALDTDNITNSILDDYFAV